MLHKDYLLKHKKVLFATLLSEGRLWQYLADIDTQSQQMFDTLVEQMKATEGVTEQLKENNQMEWVCRMQNVETRAREIIDKALGPWEQRPVFKTNVTRFTSLRKVVPQVELSIIRKIDTYFSDEDTEFSLDPSFEPTNSNFVSHEIVQPYANPSNTKIFSDLQKLEGIGLVVPVGEEHMYYAAMKSKSCKLTYIGKQYWRLVHSKLI